MPAAMRGSAATNSTGTVSHDERNRRRGKLPEQGMLRSGRGVLTSVWMASAKSCSWVNCPFSFFGCGADRFSCASRALASPSLSLKLCSVCGQRDPARGKHEEGPVPAPPCQHRSRHGIVPCFPLSRHVAIRATRHATPHHPTKTIVPYTSSSPVLGKRPFIAGPKNTVSSPEHAWGV